MEFNQLESFLSVVRYNSFSKAAKELYLTQPTISNNIKNLEKELETTLLDRTSKTITLTEPGKAFYNYALELVNLRDKAKFNIIGSLDKIEGNIELPASSIPEQYILPYIIKDFISLYPKVTFDISRRNSKDIIDDIIGGKESFGIVGAKLPSRMLNYVDFYNDEIILATSNNNYPLVQNGVLEIDDILAGKFLFRKESSGTRLFIEKCLGDKNISLGDLDIVSLLDSNETIKKMIELELGISFISKVSIQNEIKLGLIKSFNIKGLDLNRKIYFVYSKHRTLPPAVEAFRDFLTSWHKD